MTNVVKTSKIVKWGNSQGVRLPIDLLKQIGIDNPDNQEIVLKVEGNKIILKKAPSLSKLAQRFDGFDLDKYFEENPVSSELLDAPSMGNEAL
ncbi:AbrB/MazE/SpoVT family DNA-binding domain-containing protein [Lapidilactobacillus dextrinicus]|uniref:AbrB/MazE/SpoVT family DNA-binding domain-containing protein n=1 Tax=Lapidilactobacillus dextrinicus TaxID=51664 RepID=UPI00070B30AB|nr:AbrB/MazE/SpoVT family DNA-binding domain-containing protein [Lapidilactobacillus dextrinicus]QFG46704.1 AbrB/MazE/SpoVT family DNA-binding domain-containing protein [Lapidilactobacillus dextrinicus]